MTSISRHLLVALLCSSGLQATEKWNVRDAIPLNKFVIQSHRGAGELAPENSRESFELAWSLGTIPEADLRTTKDGVIVTFHDANFSRILPHEAEDVRKKGIEDMTWDEVSRLDIGVWKGEKFKGQKVLRMEDVYKLLQSDPTRRIYVDIKNVDLKQLAGGAHAAGAASRLILASTKYDIIRNWKKLARDSSTLHWMGGSEDDLTKRLEKLREAKFAGIDQLQIHIHPGKEGEPAFSPSPEFLEKTGVELREKGILFQVLPWQSRDRKLFVTLLDLGAASFATDYPDFAAETVKEYYEEAKK